MACRNSKTGAAPEARIEALKWVRLSAAQGQGGATPPYPLDYVPHYVFNSDHLWLISSTDLDAQQEFGDYCKSREDFWGSFDPRFAASVHSTIFDEALKYREEDRRRAVIRSPPIRACMPLRPKAWTLKRLSRIRYDWVTASPALLL